MHESEANRLKALAALLPGLETPGFKFGEWHEESPTKTGGMIWPPYELGDVASSLIRTAYDEGWVHEDCRSDPTSQKRSILSLRPSPEQTRPAFDGQFARIASPTERWRKHTGLGSYSGHSGEPQRWPSRSDVASF
jgi:Family of unknown function (DUF6508)